MPKIPTFQSTASPPGVSGAVYAPLNLTSQPYAVAAHGLMGISREMERINERMRLARQSTELSTAQVSSLKAMSDLEAGFSERTDFENFDPEFKTRIEELRTSYREQIKDPEVYSAFAHDFEKQALRASINISSMARKREIDHGKASYLNNINELSLMYGQTADEDKKIDILNHVKIQTTGAVAAGYMTEEAGVKSLHKFLKDADTAEAMEDLRRDPENFDASDYPGIDEKTQILLNDQALNRIEANDREHIRAVEKAEKEAEKAHEAKIDNADFDAWQAYNNNELTIPALEDMATRREISEEAYKAIRTKMEPDKEKAENNPVVIGQLAEQVELGLDVRTQLKEALKQGHIKTETYITMSRQVANKEYSEGMAFVASALKPTAADRWSADRNLRYAEAVDHYNSLVEQGTAPLNAGKEVVKGYMSDIRRTRKGLPKPKFLLGSKESWEHLDRAEKSTVQALENKQISPQEYEREVNIIHELKKIAESQDAIDGLSEKDKARAH